VIRVAAACTAAMLALAPAVHAGIEIVEVTSPGGITAWLVTDPTIPIVTLEASFRGGAVLDPAGKAGVTSLMMSLLDDGAGDLDATGFAEAREELAARFGFSAGRDGVSVSAEMLSQNREAVVDLLRSAILAPRFDADALARVRDQALASLRADETSPNRIAGRALNALAFPGHPYAIPADGTPETVAAIGADDLRAAHRATMVRDRLHVAVVGDITAAEVGPMLDRLFGDLPEGGPDLPPVAEPALAGQLSVVDLAIPQSVVAFAQPGIPRDDPDFIPAFVMNHILGGGGFGSRLTEELREQRGLTYGIGVSLATSDYGPLIAGRFSTANARAAEALALIRAEWTRMAEEGVTQAELDAAKRYLTGAYPLRFDGYGRIANQLLGLQIDGLGLDYVNRRNALVEAVTREDIARVARHLLDPDRLTFIVVGRPEGLDPTN
jgi:zinc protease